MLINIFKRPLAVILLLSLVTCGGGSSNSDSDSDTESSGGSTTDIPAGDAIVLTVMTVFSGQSSASLNKKVSIPSQLVELFIRQAMAQGTMPSTCDSLSSDVSGVTFSSSISAGTYGASDLAVTVTASQDCETNPTGTDVYAGFTVKSHSMTCTTEGGGNTTLTMSDSSGIWRNNTSSSATEIYGTFNMTMGDTSSTGNKCSFFMTVERTGGTSSTTMTGGCEDSDGNTLEGGTETITGCT